MMKSINVDGLPDSVTKALEAVVQSFREQLEPEVQRQPRRFELPRWPGNVYEPLTREEIYGDDS